MAATSGSVHDSPTDMRALRQLQMLLAAATGIMPALAAEPADRQFESLAAFSVEVLGERAEARNRMAFNQIAEGWSWQPLADPAVDDYYRYKFLPLQSVAVERGAYEFEDKIGVPQQMKVSWRYDYFLAFDNLYDFYPRVVDDEAGFSADLPADAASHLALRVRAHLVAPMISESTTFWKATYGRPTDFTLKKRYLMAVLDEVDFVYTGSDRILCRVVPGQARCSAP